jgi:hypothetical protein
MAQQTAVEWLDNKLWKLRLKLRAGKISIKFYLEQEARLILQAKEMFQEQIEDSFVAGDERGTKDIPFNAEQYYTQTYGNNTKTK